MKKFILLLVIAALILPGICFAASYILPENTPVLDAPSEDCKIIAVQPEGKAINGSFLHH